MHAETENPFQLPPDKARVVRHSVYRYLLLTYILLLRDVSIPVRKQFPTYNHLIEGKLLTEYVSHIYEISFQRMLSRPSSFREELDVMEHANIAENSCRYWQPMLWTILVLKKYYRSETIRFLTENYYGDLKYF